MEEPKKGAIVEYLFLCSGIHDLANDIWEIALVGSNAISSLAHIVVSYFSSLF